MNSNIDSFKHYTSQGKASMSEHMLKNYPEVRKHFLKKSVIYMTSAYYGGYSDLFIVFHKCGGDIQVVFDTIFTGFNYDTPIQNTVAIHADLIPYFIENVEIKKYDLFLERVIDLRILSKPHIEKFLKSPKRKWSLKNYLKFDSSDYRTEVINSLILEERERKIKNIKKLC